MTNSKNIPKRRFKEFAVDRDWLEFKLGQLMDVGSVKRVHQSDWREKGIPFLRARDIVAEAKNEKLENPLYIDAELYNSYTELTGKVKKGDILVTGVGTIGVPLLIKNEQPLYFKDGNIIWFKNNNSLDGNFFYYNFISETIQKFISDVAGIGTVGTFTIDSGKKTPIYIPTSKEEQIMIGKFFQTIDSLISFHQHKLDKLKNLKKAYLAELFPAEGERVPKRRFPGFEGEWEEKKLEELGKVITGNTPSTSNASYWSTSSKGHTWVTPTDINDILICYSERYLSDLGLLAARTVPENSVLITSIASIGKNTINTIPVAFNQQINAIVPQNHNSYFILSAMSRYEKQFKNLAGQTATPIINKLTFEKFEIPVPSIEEQEIIGEFFQRIDTTINLQQQKLDKLNDLKKAYLNELFV